MLLEEQHDQVQTYDFWSFWTMTWAGPRMLPTSNYRYYQHH
jgi:hypothetical protein